MIRSSEPLTPLLVVWLILVSGCAEEIGPRSKPTVSISGRVTAQGGRPVGGGWIEFLPVDGTVGDLRSARLKPDGTFEADRVARGSNAIRLVDPPPDVDVPRLFQDFGTPIRREVDGSTALELNVRDEQLRLLRNQRPS